MRSSLPLLPPSQRATSAYWGTHDEKMPPAVPFAVDQVPRTAADVLEAHTCAAPLDGPRGRAAASRCACSASLRAKARARPSFPEEGERADVAPDVKEPPVSGIGPSDSGMGPRRVGGGPALCCEPSEESGPGDAALGAHPIAATHAAANVQRLRMKPLARAVPTLPAPRGDRRRARTCAGTCLWPGVKSIFLGWNCFCQVNCGLT